MILNISLVLWTAIALPFVYIFYHFVAFFLDVRRRAKHVNEFPGVDPHPLWGHLHWFPGPGEFGLTLLRERLPDYPLMNKVFYGPFNPAVMLAHPQTIRQIVKTSEPKPLGTVGAYRLVAPWLGDGLLVSKGKKWARNRRLLTPAFHFDILKPYTDINNEAVELLLDKMEKFAGQDEYFEVFTHICLTTLDIILRCAFSYETNCQVVGQSHPYVKAVLEMSDTIVYRMLRPWLYPNFFFWLTPRGRQFFNNCKFVHKVSSDVIRKRQETLKSANGEVMKRSGRYLDFLDILLTCRDQQSQGLTNQEIRDEVDTFLFEGHDTTASGISWTLCSLAQNPEHMKKCQRELDEILEGRDSDKLEWDDLPKLKYLAQCIKEAMRLHSPVPFIEREMTKDTTLDGYFLPKGTIVDINIYVLHHNPEVWENSTKYIPDRFSPENLQKMDNFAFLPFSAGPRNCIGQNFAMHEMKVVVGRILRKFDLELDPQREVLHRLSVVMRTENGMWMKAVPRKQK